MYEKRTFEAQIAATLWGENHQSGSLSEQIQDSKIHGANMEPTWALSAPDGRFVGPMNLVMWEWCGKELRLFSFIAKDISKCHNKNPMYSTVMCK